MDEVVLSAAAPRGIFVTISLALRFNLPAPHYEPLAHNYSFRIIQKTDKANGAEVYYCETPSPTTNSNICVTLQYNNVLYISGTVFLCGARVHTLNAHTDSLTQQTRAHYCWQIFALEAAATECSRARATQSVQRPHPWSTVTIIFREQPVFQAPPTGKGRYLPFKSPTVI